MGGAFGELVAGMVDADVAIAEVDQAVVAAPAIGVDDGARVDPAADDALEGGLRAVLTPIWHEKSQTAQRVRQRISAVMKWAITMGYRPDNPAGDALGQALGRQQTVVQHMRALPHGAVADALATVRASQASVTIKQAFEFLVLTAARSGEVRLATWDEMDLDAAVWAIPAARMKAKRGVGALIQRGGRAVAGMLTIATAGGS